MFQLKFYCLSLFLAWHHTLRHTLTIEYLIIQNESIKFLVPNSRTYRCLPFGIQSKMLTSMTAVNMIKILQGSVVTQTMLGGLTIYPEVAISYSVQCTPAKNYENSLTVDKVIAIITRLTFLAHPVCIVLSVINSTRSWQTGTSLMQSRCIYTLNSLRGFWVLTLNSHSTVDSSHVSSADVFTIFKAAAAQP